MRLVSKAGAGIALSIVAAAIFAPTTAYAAAALTVNPSTVRPGNTVGATADCGTATSPSAGNPALLDASRLGAGSAIVMEAQLSLSKNASAPGTPTQWFAEFTVDRNIAAGTYSITVTCGDKSMASANVVVSPSGGTATGDGSTSGGMDGALLAVGGGLVALAVAGGGLLLVRRRSTTHPA